MTMNGPTYPVPRPRVNAGRLWAGGAATAVVAALIAVVGVLVGRGPFDVDVLAPEGEGVWGDADTGRYALGAGAAALIATGVAHLLILTTPRPMRFFGWVLTLATIVAMLAPLVTEEDQGARLFTAGLNAVLGVAIGSLIGGTARTAMLAGGPPPGYYP